MFFLFFFCFGGGFVLNFWEWVYLRGGGGYWLCRGCIMENGVLVVVLFGIFGNVLSFGGVGLINTICLMISISFLFSFFFSLSFWELGG